MGGAARVHEARSLLRARCATLAPDLLPPLLMPRYPQDFDTDPARNPDRDREDDFDPEGAILEIDRSVARHGEEEAEEAELAEEDILEIADLEDELEARKGEAPGA
jgi:hypothetical protein